MAADGQMKIGVWGAGLIGLYVGGCIQGAKKGRVSYYGRARMGAIVKDGFSTVTEDGVRWTVSASDLDYQIDGGAKRDGAIPSTEVDVLLVALKTGHIEGSTPPALKPDAVVVSLCNGLSAHTLLQKTFPAHRVLKGMVSFNVVLDEPNTFRQATGGPVMIERSATRAAEVADALRAAGVKVDCPPDMTGVMWAKLLLNLNNAINGLAGIPLAVEFRQREYRAVWSAAQREGLAVCHARGVVPAKVLPIPPTLIPSLLLLPDFVFVRVAKKMVSIDPAARSSLQEDLLLGRTTEIDYLCGEIVEQGKQLGIPTPVNAALVDMVKEAEKKGSTPKLTGQQMIDEVRRRGATVSMDGPFGKTVVGMVAMLLISLAVRSFLLP